jgi:hypothetical protein
MTAAAAAASAVRTRNIGLFQGVGFRRTEYSAKTVVAKLWAGYVT